MQTSAFQPQITLPASDKDLESDAKYELCCDGFPHISTALHPNRCLAAEIWDDSNFISARSKVRQGLLVGEDVEIKHLRDDSSRTKLCALNMNVGLRGSADQSRSDLIKSAPIGFWDIFVIRINATVLFRAIRQLHLQVSCYCSQDSCPSEIFHTLGSDKYAFSILYWDRIASAGAEGGGGEKP